MEHMEHDEPRDLSMETTPPITPPKRRRWRRKLGQLALVIVAIVAAMEIGSRVYACPARGRNGWPAACYQKHTQPQREMVWKVEDLKAQRIAGRVLPEAEYLALVAPVVYDVDSSLMEGDNALYCRGLVWVRSDMPANARAFVVRHELEHVLQYLLDKHELNRELSANLAAARENPAGMIEALVFSVRTRANEAPSVPCFVFGFWNSFKRYVLPWGQHTTP